MSVESVFSSKGRVRILRVLCRVGELNISGIVRKADLNYATANKHLELLKKANLIREKRFGRIRIFQFNSENRRAKAIKALLNDWESEEEPLDI
jgi:DNA-binding transcriptional ArsR family regulator